MRQVINTVKAPAAIGNYSQAVKAGNTLYLSGQIPLHPTTMAIVQGDSAEQVNQVFENIKNVVEAAGVRMADIVKLTVYLTNLATFPLVNEWMTEKGEPRKELDSPRTQNKAHSDDSRLSRANINYPE